MLIFFFHQVFHQQATNSTSLLWTLVSIFILFSKSWQYYLDLPCVCATRLVSLDLSSGPSLGSVLNIFAVLFRVH